MGFEHELPHQGKTNVWLTPKDIIQRLGPFDLDPCAAPHPRPWNTATTHIVEAEDGLSRVWSGLVWCNPPYGSQTSVWLEKLSNHSGGGIALVFARTETKWFQSVAHKASLFFFPEGRIRFCRPDGSLGDGSAGAPSVFLAFGEEAATRLKQIGIRGVFSLAQRVQG